MRKLEFGANCDIEVAKMVLQEEQNVISRSESPHSRYEKSKIRKYLRKTPSAHSINSKIEESPCFPNNGSSLAPSHKDKSENSNKKNSSINKNHFFSFNGKDLVTSFNNHAKNSRQQGSRQQELIGKENLYFKPVKSQPYNLMMNQNHIEEVEDDL